MAYSLGIVVPCYNESASLAELVKKLSNQNLRHIQFVLVNNGSTDETSEILNRIELPINIGWIQVPVNLGYGHGILAGLKHLKTDYLGWIHADLQTDPIDLLHFQSQVEANMEFLRGRRKGRPRLDRFFTAGMSLVLSIIFGRILRDINGQPTIVKRSLYEEWREPPYDFGFDLYSYVHAIRNKARISRVDINFGPRNFGKSSWNSGLNSRFRFIQRTLSLALKLRIQHRD
jgi:glycosyltransferase involved in cell wall biosynthesis